MLKRSTAARYSTIALGGLLLVVGYFAYEHWRIQGAIDRLRSNEPNVRERAADSLRNAGTRNPAVIGALVEVVVDERYTSATVANVLAGMGRPAVARLIEALNNEDAKLRHWGATTTGHLWETPRLFQALHDLNSDPDVIAALNKAMHDEDRHVRSSAAYALDQNTVERDGVRYRVTPPGPEARQDESFLYWKGMLQHQDPQVRMWAAHHLGELGHDENIDAALRDTLNDGDRRVTVVAEWFLSQHEIEAVKDRMAPTDQNGQARE